MSSNVINHEVVIDKFPGKHRVELIVHVKLSWKFKLRMKIGLWLIRLASWVMNVGMKVEHDDG